MDTKKTLAAARYNKKNPKKAKTIRDAVMRGLKQYEETFRRLANS